MTGCKKDPVSPPPPDQGEDFSYPASTKFAATLYSNQTNYKVGDNFDVKLVFYNLQNVFGAAAEISFDSSYVEITDSSKIIIGPYFKIGDSTLYLRKVEQIGRASIGISYIKGSGLVASNSGVVIKLRCKAKKIGSTTFSLNGSKLEILKNDGSFINNFSSLLKEDFSVSFQ
jgi:hypothetical protein